ncbi:Holliday junction resolvase RuvX [Chlamydia gallinacea]|uniref:Holliday junction resolvase RuvX n=1 Tax=Chlamydia gallinacea TaxID=1457153 RepID=UPI0023F45D56|nr:Holliday junction resolvase RuvX [Chlamydia gallinacea]
MHSHQHTSFLGVDYGNKRIGLAWASAPLLISLPIGFINTGKTIEETVNHLHKIIQEKRISCVILGNPIPMNTGQLSYLQEDIRKLASMLQKYTETILWDERLSSVQAERLLKTDCGLSRKQRKGKTDSIAATLILSSFLDTLSHPRSSEENT